MKLFSLVLLILSFNSAIASSNFNKMTHVKVTKAILSLQSGNWILDDLTAKRYVYCKTPEAQVIFDQAHQSLGNAAGLLKKSIASGNLNDQVLGDTKKMAVDSFNAIKSLLFLREIVIVNKTASVKFDEVRFRQMKAAIALDEYHQNGDQDAYSSLNQRNTALGYLMQRVPKVWKNELVKELPSFLSQGDLKLVDTLIKSTNHGAMSRYLNAYFTNHENIITKYNFKGDMAVLIVKHAGGWGITTLKILPKEITEEMAKAISLIITTSKESMIATYIQDYIASL